MRAASSAPWAVIGSMCFAVLLLCTNPAIALAQSGDLEEELGTDAPRARASRLLREGNALFAKKDYERALATYEQAYEAFASPKLFYSLARANHRLGRLEEASTYYDLFLVEGGVNPSSALYTTARGALAEASSRLMRVTIEASQSGAKVTVDGTYRARTPAPPLYVSPGRRLVAVELAGFNRYERSIHARAGQSRTLEVLLESTPAPALALSGPGNGQAPGEGVPWLEPEPPDPGGESTILTSPWFWGIAASVVVLGAVSASVLATRGGGGPVPSPELGAFSLSDWGVVTR